MGAKPNGPYTLWIDYGYEGWQPTDFATLKEAVEAEKHSNDWVVTKLAQYVLVDLDADPVKAKAQWDMEGWNTGPNEVTWVDAFGRPTHPRWLERGDT